MVSECVINSVSVKLRPVLPCGTSSDLYAVLTSDVKRGQILEAKAEAGDKFEARKKLC